MKTTIYLFALLTAFSAAFSQVPVNHSVTSTKGNIEVTITNDGRIGYNPNLNESGFVWPRGSNAQYLYGGGFLLVKDRTSIEAPTYYSEFSYNPIDATTWFTPGSIDDGDNMRPDLASKYRVYSSLDYDKKSGVDLKDDSNPKWPIWTAADYLGTNYGEYKLNEAERSNTSSDMKTISDEDIVSIYKDTDTNINIGAVRGKYPFPVGVDAQTRVYSFEDENHKNTIFINWVITNNSSITNNQFVLAPVFDVDITKKTNRFSGLDNDIIFFDKESIYATFATEMGEYEKDESFGYMSFKWVELPTVYNSCYVDYINPERREIGKWGIFQMKHIDLEEFGIQSNQYERDSTSIGYKKFFMFTESVCLAPNQSASFVLQINMTLPNEDYPNMDEATRNKIEAELAANELFFNQRLTSVEVAEELSPISVFPNPTVDGKLSVELGLPIGEQMSIELFDLAGNTLGKLYQGMHHSQNYELNIGKRAAGTYLLRFTVGEKTYSKKFVVGG